MILLPVTGLTSFRSLRQQGCQISEYDSLTAPLVTTALAGGGTAAGIASPLTSSPPHLSRHGLGKGRVFVLQGLTREM